MFLLEIFYLLWYILGNDRKGEHLLLWRKQDAISFADGTGAPVDLRTMVGSTGRLLFATSPGGHQMVHVPCKVLSVSRTDLVVELHSQEGPPQNGSAVILEVAQATALVQCFTSVRRRGPANRVALAIPSRPHVLQRRRFPRIDLFTGVTVRFADDALDELPAQMINLSVDGAAFVVAEPITPATRLLVNLSPIGLHPAEAPAAVVRCTPSPSHLWVVGIKFHRLSPEQELYLGKYISLHTDSV